jgi:hypothetical protein
VKRLTGLEGKTRCWTANFAIAELALRCRARTFNERNGTANFVDAKKIPLRNQRFFTDIAENPRKECNFAQATFSVQ